MDGGGAAGRIGCQSSPIGSAQHKVSDSPPAAAGGGVETQPGDGRGTAPAWEQLAKASVPSPGGLLYRVKGGFVLGEGASRHPLVETGGGPGESQPKMK